MGHETFSCASGHVPHHCVQAATVGSWGGWPHCHLLLPPPSPRCPVGPTEAPGGHGPARPTPRPTSDEIKWVMIDSFNWIQRGQWCSQPGNDEAIRQQSRCNCWPQQWWVCGPIIKPLGKLLTWLCRMEASNVIKLGRGAEWVERGLHCNKLLL